MPSRTITETDPKQLGPKPPHDERKLDAPGSEQEMRRRPDHGEQTYWGSGRLHERVAIITGADSGIGKAVALAYAREGADVLIGYLPEEESDAQDTVRLVNNA